MALWTKDNNVWKVVNDPRVATGSSQYSKIKEGWVKVSGVWQRFYLRPVVIVTPPDVTIVRSGTTQFRIYVNGGDVTANRVSVWARLGSAPSTIEGGTNQIVARQEYDPTTEFSVYWTAPQSEGLTYYAAAVLYDLYDNASLAATNSVSIPPTTTYYTKYINPVGSGTYRPDTDVWRASSDVVQGGDTNNKGCWFYGTRLDELKGKTITKMEIQIARLNESVGLNTAVVRLCHHENKNQPNGNPGAMRDDTLVGELKRGEQAWFSVPKSWHDSFSSGAVNYRGLGLYTEVLGENNKHYLKTHAASDNVSSGRLYVEYHD